MIRAYLLALSMLGLGLAGVVVIASQASRSPASAKGSGGSDAMTPELQAKAPMGMSGAMTRPRPRPATADASVARPTAASDAAVARTSDAAVAKAQDAAAAKAQDAAAAKAQDAAAGSGPPRHAGPAPTLVVEFKAGSSRVTKKVRRAIRKLVDEHGYKNVSYKLTGYGAERRKPKHNRSLAKRRCRRVARQIRKRGVSRRWIRCGDPVYRDVKRKATDADKAPEWRRVEIRVEKP